MTLKEIGTIINQSLTERFAGGRFIVSFAHTETKDRCLLVATYGEGSTRFKAKQNYAKKLSGARIVVNALSGRKRQEFHLPEKITVR